MNFNVQTFRFNISTRKLFTGLSTLRITFSDFLVFPTDLSGVMKRVRANDFKAP